MEPHAPSASIAYAGLGELQDGLASGTITSAAIVSSLLERIAAIDAPGTATEVRSILAIASDALEQAVQCDAERARGVLRGPLHGIPVAVKDNIEAVGLPGTAGSLALLDSPVAIDAPVVARLRAAGAIVVASTNLSEWANMRSTMSSSGWSAVGGLVANPWALDRSAGGSSSGSGAALAAGLVPLALGTETDGSIVCPAALNGVVGLKPTVGALPVDGIVPISHSQDTPGPMARCVRDVRALWEVLSDAAVPAVDVRSLRVAAVPTWLSGLAHTDDLFGGVLQRVRDAGLFAAVGEAAVPAMGDSEGLDEYTVLLAELHDDLADYLARREPVSGVRTLADVIAFNLAHADEELVHFGQEHFDRAVARGGVDAESTSARERGVQWARAQCLDPALAEWDVLLAPTYVPAWKHDFVLGHPSIGGGVTSPAAVAGYPILSLPMGLVHELPVGLALVGRPGSEHVLLAVAEAVEGLLALDAHGAWRPPFKAPARG
jgi:amidase